MRRAVLVRLAGEIQEAWDGRPELRAVLGHGSGSFGHVAGARYGTRTGVETAREWFGFAEVSDAALRLNRLVVSALLVAGLPALSLSPSASADVSDGQIRFIATEPIARALDHRLLPVIHGDVAFDDVRGGTILSTEEVIAYLLGELPAGWLLLAGETDGVYGADGRTIPRITPLSYRNIAPALGGSRGIDVTGGMIAKVEQMLALVSRHPELRVRIFSGLVEGALATLLHRPDQPIGTEIAAD